MNLFPFIAAILLAADPVYIAPTDLDVRGGDLRLRYEIKAQDFGGRTPTRFDFTVQGTQPEDINGKIGWQGRRLPVFPAERGIYLVRDNAFSEEITLVAFFPGEKPDGWKDIKLKVMPFSTSPAQQRNNQFFAECRNINGVVGYGNGTANPDDPYDVSISENAPGIDSIVRKLRALEMRLKVKIKEIRLVPGYN